MLISIYGVACMWLWPCEYGFNYRDILVGMYHHSYKEISSNVSSATKSFAIWGQFIHERFLFIELCGISQYRIIVNHKNFHWKTIPRPLHPDTHAHHKFTGSIKMF